MNTSIKRLLYTFACALFLTGCVTTDYMGKTYAPTEHVDVYFDRADVEQAYEVMGEVRAEGDNAMPMNTSEKMQRKLIETARAKGADGIIIGSVEIRQKGQTETTSGETKKRGDSGRFTETTTTTVEEVKEVRALLIKYKPLASR